MTTWYGDGIWTRIDTDSTSRARYKQFLENQLKIHCYICGLQYKTFVQLVDHYKNKHPLNLFPIEY